MSLAGRSIVSIDDLSNQDIDEIFGTADTILERGIRAFTSVAQGHILATLFFEPSTRTRLSFEAAMARLGGRSISAWDTSTTSFAKGETLADTIRVVSKYADAVVLRHPWDGSAQLAAKNADVPVINAGDGGHEHPTQTLCDLYTLRKRHGDLRGLKVALCGDLQRGRTVHSLAFALARLKAEVIFVPGNGKEIPDYVLRRLERDYGATITRAPMGVLSALFGRSPDEDIDEQIDAIYMTPTKPNQLAMVTEEGTELVDTETHIELKISGKEKLALYVTRLQSERPDNLTEEADQEFPTVTRDVLRVPQFKNISILHPLPRVDEINPEVDKDPRSVYFQQAAYGIPIRMALLIKILALGRSDEGEIEHLPYDRPAEGPVAESDVGVKCTNPNCVNRREPKSAPGRYEVVDEEALTLRCLYCDFELRPRFFGVLTSHKYYPIADFHRLRPSLANVAFFNSPSAAQKAKFERGRLQVARSRAKKSDVAEVVHR